MDVFNITGDAGLPAICRLSGLGTDDFISFYTKNKGAIEDVLMTRGAIKFRGVSIDSVATFQKTVDSISDKFLSYIDGNSPRTKLSGNVYTSTEYDQAQKITMHNELSYSAKWPNKLFFSCLQRASTGGETLLADSREILIRMDRDIVGEVRNKGIVYIRNLHGGTGMGPSWQDTFETEDKAQLEVYCRAYSIAFEWGSNDSLQLKQPGRGIIRHRATGEELWFNQIDQFHPCHLGEETFEALQLMYDTPENFPMYVMFGDGTEIAEAFVREVMRTIDVVTIAPAWENDELLIVDNELVCHGRNPYAGSRKVLVAMSE